MKLYFWFLERPRNEEPHIRFEECEVIEKPKTFKPVDKFPSGFYGAYVFKNELNQAIHDGRIYISGIPDHIEAKEKLRLYWTTLINKMEMNINKFKMNIDAIERFNRDE